MNNEYDNQNFFDEYAKMPRSREGLSAAGEWHQLKPLFPSVKGKKILDLGCGYGWHCKFAAEQGAAHVLGIDLSSKMIEEAKKRNAGEQIEYRVCGIDEYEYPENTWDCVISNLALHYIEDIELIFQKIHRTLKPDGIFLFNIEHPVFTAGVGQDWIYTDVGTPKYWPIDNYFFSGERKTHFLGCDVVKQHHTLTQIMMGLLNNSFELKVVEEAEPPQEMMDIPGFQDELRRPMMLLVKSIARKPIIKEKLRLSQVLCKPPAWCRIEAPHRRFYIWPERIVPRKKMPGEKKYVSCCRWQTSAAWMTFRVCSRRPLPSSWRTAWRQSWMTSWATANMTTSIRTQITAAMATAARRCVPASEMWRYQYLETGRGNLSLRC